MESSFDEVIARLRAGDEDAASEIVRKYVKQLVALASRKFDDRVRSKADPEDVVQSAYKSFFLRDVQTPFLLSDWEDLWTTLTLITVRKCYDRHKFWKRERRNVGREVFPPPDATGEWWGAFDREPTPVQALVMNENLERLLAHFKAKSQDIVQDLFQGYTQLEISRRRDCSERTVSRVSSKVKLVLGEMDLVEVEA